MAGVFGNTLYLVNKRQYEFSCHAAAFAAMCRLSKPHWKPIGTREDPRDLAIEQRIREENQPEELA